MFLSSGDSNQDVSQLVQDLASPQPRRVKVPVLDLHKSDLDGNNEDVGLDLELF